MSCIVSTLHLTWPVAFFAMAALSGGHTIAREDGKTAEIFSSKLRALSSEIRSVEEQLEENERPVFTQTGRRLGFHSRTFFRPDEPDSLIVDLGTSFRIDMIALVPVVVDTPLFSDRAYGFPQRFRVEIANEQSFMNPTVVADETENDFPDPGRFPVCYEPIEKRGRYIRITSTLHARNLEHFIWALSELVVLSGNRNVAAGAEVIVERSAHFPPAWVPENLTDSESAVSIPMTEETSPSNGWLADQKKPPDPEKWVAVEWDNPLRVDEIRLIPARPTDMADTPGMGFPLKFRMEGKLAENGDWISLYAPAAAIDVRTSESPVVVSGIDRDLAGVRFVAEVLPRQGTRYQFALAELQVYSGDVNIAAGETVTASDSFLDSHFPRWQPDFLVDGFTSQYKLVEWPKYFHLLQERGEAIRRLDKLEKEYATYSSRVSDRLFGGLLVLVAMLVLGSGLILARGTLRRKEETRRLREQIARDLHDDIGSNLGGIALLSGTAGNRDDLPEDVREDMEEIHEIAKASSESMRDIVWLVQEKSDSLRELAIRMKNVANRTLGGIKWDWSESLAGAGAEALPLDVRRHFLLAFKEAIYNAARHSRAERVSVEIAFSPSTRRLRFEVKDDGVGIPKKNAEAGGLGLANLKLRAERLRGTCDIDTSPDRGTVVRFEAPLR